jgi:hypothetical protein
MDGFKNTTKTSYDTTSGRKFANGGMTVSRADMPGGEGPMNKPALVAKYAKGGPVKMREGGTFNEKGKRATMGELAAEDRRMAGRPSEGVSSRPTDASGRRATDAELGMTSSAKKAVGPSSVAVSKVLAGMAKKAARNVDPRGAVMDGDMMRYGDRALVRKAARMADPRGAVMEGEKDRYGKGGKVMAKKAVKKNMGGGVNSKLGNVITQAKSNMAAAPRAKSTFVDTMPKGGPQKPTSGNPLMGGLNRGDVVASKHTPTRGPSMAPAHSNRPMIRRAMGGLSVMPKGGKC